MSYASILSSIFGKRPIWLYHFQKDGAEVFYTSRGTDYSDTRADFFDQENFFFGEDVFNIVWKSTPIYNSALRSTSAIGRAEIDFVLPQTNEWAQSYIGDNGYEDNLVLVYHLFTNDPDLEKSLKFRGRVIASRPMLTRITLLAENRFTELARKGISAVIQRPCRHALYHSRGGLGCNLSIADFETETTLSAISAGVADVPAAASQADGYYAGGVISWNGKRQLITAHSGSSLTMLGPIAGLTDALAEGSQTIKIAPGCDLTRQTCNDRFNNLANFGGFPWATETPYDGKTLF